ncbi:MAG: hypothetical protein HC767_08725 [Akkermansiaceae bacterium]|nr:hypothetical protein [Akkermansiaceae bacterium]
MSSQGTQAPIIVVDNLGGEFVETMEPGAAGADLVTGSLLGSLGGSIAPSGGYVCGDQELVDKACARFSAPGTVPHAPRLCCIPCCWSTAPCKRSVTSGCAWLNDTLASLQECL